MVYDQLQPKLRESKNPVLQNIGKYGCYFLSLLQIAGHPLGDETYEQMLLYLYDKFLTNKWIDRDCYLEAGGGIGILGSLTGKKFKLVDVRDPHLPTDIDYTSAGIIYEYRAFNGEGSHFRTLDVDTEVSRERKLIGYRIYIKVEG
jgi:hypothetical protein